MSGAGPSLKVISSSALVDSVDTVLICFLFKLQKNAGKERSFEIKAFYLLKFSL